MTYINQRDGVLHLRVPEEAKGRWVAAADAAGVSLATWVIAALETELARAALREAIAVETPATAPVVPTIRRMTLDGAPVGPPELADDGIDIAAVIDGTAAFPTGAEFDAGFPTGRDDPPAVVAAPAPKVTLTPEERARIQRAFRGG